ncbi:Hematopoietic prostaglandin D synthase-like 3, partial [Homarus americanus]
ATTTTTTIMPEYKLIYFNARGRAELSRWIMAYGNITYTDERVEKEDWPEKKKSLHGGKVPLLMVDDKPLPQSMAIARYLAKQAGLVPQDDMDSAYCDAVTDTLNDCPELSRRPGNYRHIARFSSMSEEEKKKTYREEFFPNVMEPVLVRLNKRLEEREWFVTDKVTWADFMISLVFGEVRKRKADLLEPFPKVVALVQRVRDLPAIKQWLETSPDTPF